MMPSPVNTSIITAHQRPKLERYGDTLFVVLRSAHYRDEIETEGRGERQ